MKNIIPYYPPCKKMSTSNKNELVDWILTDRNMFLFFYFFITLWHRHAIIVTINFIFYYIFKTAFLLFAVMKRKKKKT